MKTYIFVDPQNALNISAEGFEGNRWHFVVFLEKDFRINTPLKRLKGQLHKQCRIYQAPRATPAYLEDLMKMKLGEYHVKAHKNSSFIIATASNNFDHIIGILNKEGRKCIKLLHPNIKNASSALGLEKTEESSNLEEKGFSDEALTIIRNLKTIVPARRPRTVAKFKNYITNFYKDYEYGEEMTEMLYDEMLNKEAITLKKERLKYHI